MRRNKIVLLLSVFLVSASVLTMQDVSVYAKTPSEIDKEMQENKDKIENLEKEKDDIESKKNSESNSLEDIQNKLSEKNKVLSETQDKLNKTKNEIETLETRIDEISKDIEVVEGEIEDAESEIETKQEVLGKRLRGMYKYKPGNQYLSLLLSANSFGELISNLTNINSIVKTDNKLIDEVETIKNELVSNKNDLNSKKDQVKEDIDNLNSAKSEYESAAKSYEEQVKELEKLEEERVAALNKLSDREKEIQNEISQFEEDNADLQKYFDSLSNSNNESNSSGGSGNAGSTGGSSSSGNSSGNSSGGSSNSGNSSSGSSGNSSSGNSGSGSVSQSGFIKPTAGVLTSPYGPRIHPITGKQSFHKGIDLAAGTGTPIMATKGGVVTTSMYESSYGNMIIVDHGNGYSSLYAHCSKLNASVGQRVSQGEVIALMGSTGNSTGPHLHFEIRINGQTVDPMNYIS